MVGKGKTPMKTTRFGSLSTLVCVVVFLTLTLTSCGGAQRCDRDYPVHDMFDEDGVSLAEVADDASSFYRGEGEVQVGQKVMICGRFLTYSEEREVRQLFDDARHALGMVHCKGSEFVGMLGVGYFRHTLGTGSCVVAFVESVECADYDVLNPYEYMPYKDVPRPYNPAPVYGYGEYREHMGYDADYYLMK